MGACPQPGLVLDEFMFRITTLFALFLLAFSLFVSAAQAGKFTVRVYFGTYTGSGSKGIYTCLMDPESGQLTKPELAVETEQPSFLALHPNRKYVYAVNETSNHEGKKSGALSAFAIEDDGKTLRFLNQVPTRGVSPCHLCVDKEGKAVLVANYSGGSVISIRIKDDGRLGETASFVQHQGSSVLPRQKSPHAHSIALDAANNFAFVSDLGTDKIVCYKFNRETQTLDKNADHPFVKSAPGSGPRHFAIHPDQKFGYGLNEINCTITTYSLDPATGELKPIQTISTHPDGVRPKGKSTAEIYVHPSGKFVYSSNRGHDSIAAFAIDQKTGKLSLVEIEKTGGRTPRSFGIAPGGNHLLAANQNTNDVFVFEIDAKSGELKPTGTKIEVPKPVCVIFLPR